ncbi:Protein of unknown function [Paracoccus laeviglucosivorans]|uniref:Uncharacterized protein n=1 Tax=Paracoccus laeviglucosivorans TaxID=1197861 RepID=A0A521FV06_9RHOB|nr:Protein of unknown function [Paracoccus laeviglucosivorans]
MPQGRPIRSVNYEDASGHFRIVADTNSMGRALLSRCNVENPAFRAAVRAIVEFEQDGGDAEDVRNKFIDALIEAGVYVRAE